MSDLIPRQYSFNQVAGLYDEVRPGYPEEIIEATVSLSGLPPEGKILEIGCGTGKITIPFAARGFHILALEPGNELAAIALQKCQSYPQVKIMQKSFESWPLEQEAFDLVLAAQAFHWISPDYGCARAASALKRGGAIALVWNIDVSEHTDFWQSTQHIYDAYYPQTVKSTGIDRSREALCRCDAFDNLSEVRHSWDKVYTCDEYLKLLDTFSNHRTLPEPKKTLFFRDMTEVIHRSGGVVPRYYETLLLLARKR
jgi:SAM-dependent methyltransferase